MSVELLDRKECFDFLPGALIEIDLHSRKVIFMNRIAQSLFNYSDEDVEVGLSLRSIFLNDAEYEGAIRVAEAFGLNSFQNQTAYSRYEKQDLYDFRFRRKDGDEFYGECQGSFVLNKDKVPMGARIYIRDVTQHRLAEAAHIQDEEKYRSLVENSSDLIFLIDTGQSRLVP